MDGSVSQEGVKSRTADSLAWRSPKNIPPSTVASSANEDGGKIIGIAMPIKRSRCRS